MEVVYEILLSVAIKIVLYSHFCRFWNGNKRVFTYETDLQVQLTMLAPFNSEMITDTSCSLKKHLLACLSWNAGYWLMFTSSWCDFLRVCMEGMNFSSRYVHIYMVWSVGLPLRVH